MYVPQNRQYLKAAQLHLLSKHVSTHLRMNKLVAATLFTTFPILPTQRTAIPSSKVVCLGRWLVLSMLLWCFFFVCLIRERARSYSTQLFGFHSLTNLYTARLHSANGCAKRTVADCCACRGKCPTVYTSRVKTTPMPRRTGNFECVPRAATTLPCADQRHHHGPGRDPAAGWQEPVTVS